MSEREVVYLDEGEGVYVAVAYRQQTHVADVGMLHPTQKRAAERETKRAAQEDLQSLRTWEFLGGKEGDMWLLTDDQAGR